MTTDPAYSASLPGGDPSLVSDFGYAYSLDNGSVTGSGSKGNGFTIVIGGVPEPSTFAMVCISLVVFGYIGKYYRAPRVA